MKLVDVVNESIKRVEEARAKVDKARLGMQVKSHDEIERAASLRLSLACPRRGAIHPAAWVLNMNYSVVCAMLRSGLYVYRRKGGSK